MKLAKLSLAAIVVAGLASSSFAADTLADAFKNGKVNGELRAWYWDRNTNDTTSQTTVAKGDAAIFNTGLILGYVTDKLYGFSMGATFQSNYAPAASSEAKYLYAKDEFGSGAVLSEAYLAYTMKNTIVKVGRQFIATPLVSGSGSRMIKEAFEGATIVNTDVPATTLVAGYVTKFQARTTGAISGLVSSDIPEFTKTAIVTAGTGDAVWNGTKFVKAGTVFAFDGAYTAAAINKSITNLTLTAQYAQVNDVANVADVDMYYAEANYVLPMSGFKLGFDGVYRGSKTGSALDDYNLEGAYAAARIGVSELAGFGASFAYGSTSKSDAVIAGVGNGPTTYTAMLIRGPGQTLDKDTDSYLFQATYDFAGVGATGLKALAQYGVSKQNDADVISGATSLVLTPRDIKFTNLAFGLSYDVAAVKGLNLAAQYETQEKDTSGVSKVDTNEYRFMANYKF
ncbi:MAG: OprD family outer membrane porin [Campylobacteraceae bacterium]|nr:OprD family outer membrane porin [Campylobacteraceae bacterium]MBV5277964.1 OprD family outer membrane porin [Campylobacteraceae bacterium]